MSGGVLVVAMCKASAPICPKCGRSLGIHVARPDRVVGRCQNGRRGQICGQHYSAIGFDNGSALVVALSSEEFRRIQHGQPIEVERARIAYGQEQSA